MFDGKTFLPVTGTPMRKMACISRPLADADPVPFGVAILKAKSLVRSMDSFSFPLRSQLPDSRWRAVRATRYDANMLHRELRRIPLWPLNRLVRAGSGKRLQTAISGITDLFA